jgi:hypothetical protein
MCSLAWDGFGQHKLVFILCALCHWSTHVETPFLSLLAWDEFDLHVLRCIFSIWFHDLGLVEIQFFSTQGLDAYYVLVGMV